MTGINVLLDTNIVSALLKGETTVANNIDDANEVYIPVIVIGELYYGAEYSTQIQKNVNNILKLSQTYTVLSADAETARLYGAIKSALRKQGTPIPENDIWIAALAKQYRLTLITRDKHFSHIGELDKDNW